MDYAVLAGLKAEILEFTVAHSVITNIAITQPPLPGNSSSVLISQAVSHLPHASTMVWQVS